MIINLLNEINNPLVHWGSVAYLVPVIAFVFGRLIGMNKRGSFVLALASGGSILLGAFVLAIVAFVNRRKAVASNNDVVATVAVEMPYNAVPAPVVSRATQIELKPRGFDVPEVLEGGERDLRRDFTEGQREKIFSADGYQCRICGTGEDLQADHIHPWSKGGQTIVSNGQTLCGPCNRTKSDTVPGLVTV